MNRSGTCGPPGVDGVVRDVPLDELRDGIGVDDGSCLARNVNSFLEGGAASSSSPPYVCSGLLSSFSFSRAEDRLGVRNICWSFIGENISPPIALRRS